MSLPPSCGETFWVPKVPALRTPVNLKLLQVGSKANVVGLPYKSRDAAAITNAVEQNPKKLFQNRVVNLLNRFAQRTAAANS